jgi:hypothetical protein
MKNRGHVFVRIAMAIVWIAVTAGIAFLVARNTDPKSTAASITADLPPVGSGTRTTVTLSNETIAPVLSLDGTVKQDGAGWILEAPVAPADLAYRLIDPPASVKALIKGGPVGFDCAWAGTGQATDGSVTGRCTIPSDVKVIAGLQGTMVLQLESGTNTPSALPVTAVAGSSGQGQIVVVNADGLTTVHAVQIGASDAFWVEIVSGVEPSDQVLEYPTERDFAQATS